MQATRPHLVRVRGGFQAPEGQAPRPHLVRVRGGFKAVCPCGWTSETKRSQSDVLDRLDSHQRGIRAKPREARCFLAVPLPLSEPECPVWSVP